MKSHPFGRAKRLLWEEPSYVRTTFAAEKSDCHSAIASAFNSINHIFRDVSEKKTEGKNSLLHASRHDPLQQAPAGTDSSMVDRFRNNFFRGLRPIALFSESSHSFFIRAVILFGFAGIRA
jgi:hypothetical protein